MVLQDRFHTWPQSGRFGLSRKALFSSEDLLGELEAHEVPRELSLWTCVGGAGGTVLYFVPTPQVTEGGAVPCSQQQLQRAVACRRRLCSCAGDFVPCGA